MSAARLDAIATEGEQRRARPVIAISPIPELRRAIENKLAQSLEIALDERMQHRPDRRCIDRLSGEQDAYRTILRDLDHLEHRA